MFNHLVDTILAAAFSPWAFLVLGTLTIVDALFPIVPSESIVISMAALFSAQNKPLLIILFVVAATCAWIGDNLAYSIGRTKWLQNSSLLHRPKIAAAMEWSRKELSTRGATIIIVGRFIPGVRIAINIVCGIIGYDRKRYMGVVCASASLWAGYSVVIGSIAGVWFHHHPLLGVSLAVLLGVILGPVIDWGIRSTVLKGDQDDVGANVEDADADSAAGTAVTQ